MTNETTQHIDEVSLERFVLEDATLGEHREAIEFHLQSCEGCSERVREMKEYYGEVRALVRTQQQALITTEKIAPLSLYDSTHVSEYVSVPRWNPIARFLIRYPVAASFGFVGLCALLLILVLRSPVHKDANPEYAEAKEGFLIVFNKTGEELFRKQFYLEYDFKMIKPTSQSEAPYSQEHYFTVADVDGDGKNEVLLQMGWVKERPEQNSILCFNADGSERWRFQFRRTVPIQSESVTDDFMCDYFSVKDFDGDGKMDIVALFRHSTYSPSAIVRLDASNGTLRGEYWHAGWLYRIGEFSMPNSAITMIVAGGINNGLRLADVLVLDPRNLSGQTPTSKGYTIPTVGRGSQEQYITFPRNGPEQLKTQLYNETRNLRVANDNIVAFVAEHFEGKLYVVATVQFDNNMNILAVTPHDDFRAYITELRKNGATSVKDPADYLSGFRSGIRYWNGQSFVSEREHQTHPQPLP